MIWIVMNNEWNYNMKYYINIMNFFGRKELIMNFNYQFETDIIKSNRMMLNFSISEIKLLFIDITKMKYLKKIVLSSFISISVLIYVF